MSHRSGESSTDTAAADKEKLRQRYRTKLAKALNEDDDPLATYNQFIQWTIKNYGERDSKSGLLELLKDATTQFKQDPMYKNDLRYLKIWALYARQLDRAGAIAVFASLVESGIGTSYAALYEEYATFLEYDGRHKEAEQVYIKGIEARGRPLERLKTRYKDFQARAKKAASIAASSSSTARISSTSASGRSLGRTASTSSIASTSAPSTTSANIVSIESSAASRYALMLAPPPPGKRPEKLMFNMGLLFTDDGVEYSIQEARARSMGLLGKKWGPPPPSELPIFLNPASSSTSAPVDFNDDGLKSTTNMRRRSAYGVGAEPTVTINTKEALADVFGMYNSPDKTTKMSMPGSKHAPLKKVEPVTPMVVPKPPVFSKENENSVIGKTPGSAFKPFKDPSAGTSQNNATPGANFSVYVEEQNKTPYITPRNPFLTKDASTPFSFTRAPPGYGSENSRPPQQPKFTQVPQVFHSESAQIPLAPLRDVFTDDHGKPTPKAKPIPTHERAKSHHDIPTGGPSIQFDENAKTPRVFIKPGEQNQENPFRVAFTPKTPFAVKPFTDGAAQGQQIQPQPPSFTPFGKARAFPFAEKPITPAPQQVVEEPTEVYDEEDEEEEAPQEDEGEEYEEEYEEEEGEQVEIHEQEDDHYDEQEDQEYYEEQYETPLAPEPEPGYQREVPLGGRFGAFNVMTPITERTFELTSTGGRTPSERYGRPLDGEGSPKGKGYGLFFRDELGAAADAERLAAELRQNTIAEVEEEEEVEEAQQPDFIAAAKMSSPREERTGGLSLVDTLTLTSKFRPANPCNPFESSIISTLLTRIQTDPHFYDLRDQESQILPQLQKFFKKTTRKGSSAAVGDIFPLTLNGNRFQLSEKLGEGGFGCVYKARDLGVKLGNDNSDSDSDLDFEDDDEESISLVALKLVSPRNLWEYHILRRLHKALSPTLRRSIVLPHALYAFSDESFLVMDYCPQGMLLDIVNNAVTAGVSQAGACLDELLVMFFSIELLRLLEGMHSIGFIHGDLKIDNCLIRLEDVPGGASAWSAQYQPSGEGGWSFKGLKVIDFGRTIDTRLFPERQAFMAEWDVDERDCFEIQEGKPWTYETDYYGLAGIVYCMLFGKYMSLSAIVENPEALRGADGRPSYKIGTPFKRYWQAEIWNKLFDLLLNPKMARADGSLPLCNELGAVRREMEEWLKAHCNRTSNTLKGLLKKVEMSCYV